MKKDTDSIGNTRRTIPADNDNTTPHGNDAALENDPARKEEKKEHKLPLHDEPIGGA